MNIKLVELIASMQDILRGEVLDEVASPHARSQVLAILDLMEKLKALADWSPALIREQCDTLAAGHEALLRAAADIGGSKPEPRAPGLADGAGFDWTREHHARIETLNDWVDWLYEQGDALGQDRRRGLERQLREIIQATLASERRRISVSDYSAMSR